MKKWILRAPIAVIVIASAIAYLRMIPGGLFHSPWDKAAHMAIYGWLAAALAMVLAPRWQAFALDFAADTAGVILGYAFFRSTSR